MQCVGDTSSSGNSDLVARRGLPGGTGDVIRVNVPAAGDPAAEGGVDADGAGPAQ